ncbi:MAG TPA: hypothetical protein VGN17_30465 [Bryobacteraceae bacterium]|jgi:hypothetical protein
MGPFTTIFDLVFALVLLASVASLLAAALFAIFRRGARALHVLKIWAMGAAVYLTLLLAVSFAQPQRVLHTGDLRCWDDWCMTVERVQRSTESGEARYDVALRISSRALRVNQRALDAKVYLVDDQGHRYSPVKDDSAIPLNVLLHPGESLPTARSFTLPEDARNVGLIANHGDGPGNFIIGDEASFFHKRTVVRFP